MRMIEVLVLAAVLASGAAAQEGKKAQSQSRLDDRDLEEAIRTRFARSKIAANNFQVRVQGGVATLEGRTDVVQHKGTATRLARAAGARQVVNRIEVTEAAKEKASANLSKGRRRAQIKRGVARHEERKP